jgi:hypothetical protein
MTSIVVTAYIERLEIQLEEADGSNWAAFMARTKKLTAGARGYVEDTPRLKRAFDAANARCLEYAEALAAHGLSDPKAAAIKAAKTSALLALADLRKELKTAKPNKRAKKLGLEW